MIGFLVYGNAMFNGFVWDDYGYIINNTTLHTFNLFQLLGSHVLTFSGYYRPVMAVYFAFLYQIFGTKSFFYHSVQIGLHITNAMLVYVLFKQFFKKNLAVFLAIIFLIHPINTEAVAYVAATQEVLFFFFGMSALFLTRAFHKKNQLNLRLLMLVGLCLFLSLFVKEVGILFFMPIPLLVHYERKPLRAVLLTEAVLVLFYVLVRFMLGTVSFTKYDFVPIMRLTLLERLINIPWMVWHYLVLLFFPKNLAVDTLTVITAPNATNFYLPLLFDCVFIIALILFGLYLYYKKKKLLFPFFFFFFWSVIGLGIHMQLFPLDLTVADRWFYFPLVGFLGMIGCLFEQLPLSTQKSKTMAALVACLLIFVLATRTMLRNVNWYDELTLLDHDSKVNDNYDIENNLGKDFMEQGDIKSALIHIKKSVALFPYEANLYNLAFLFEKTGNLEAARNTYYRALSAKNYSNVRTVHFDTTYINMIRLLIRLHKEKEAARILEKALAEYPNVSELWELSAVAFYELHQHDKALAAAKKAYELMPTAENANVYTKLQKNLPLKIVR